MDYAGSNPVTLKVITIHGGKTMKCVKMNDGSIRRVTDYMAEEIVKENKGAYCPKAEWKALKPPKGIIEKIISKVTKK